MFALGKCFVGGGFEIKQNKRKKQKKIEHVPFFAVKCLYLIFKFFIKLQAKNQNTTKKLAREREKNMFSLNNNNRLKRAVRSVTSTK